jgi:hypothetical protein
MFSDSDVGEGNVISEKHDQEMRNKFFLYIKHSAAL